MAFYDKIKDLEKAIKSEKRAIEKDNAIQLRLFPEFKQRKKFEIFRMEVRLSKRQKMKQLFTKFGIKADLTLKSLFKPSISKKILLHYLDEIESRRPPLLDYKAHNDKTPLTELIINNPELGAKRILQLFGLSKATEDIPLRELRSMFSKCNQRSWQRLMSEVKEVRLSKRHNHFEEIRKNILKGKALRLYKH